MDKNSSFSRGRKQKGVKQSFEDREYNRMYAHVSSLQCARYGIHLPE
jgi:hypothetical protein